MRMNLKAFSSALLLFAFLAPSSTVSGQTIAGAQTVPAGRAEIHELVLRDGSRLFGSVERETATEVVFRTHAGATVTANRADIVSLRPVKGRIEQGEFLRTDVHRSRLFFAPTGRSLVPGRDRIIRAAMPVRWRGRPGSRAVCALAAALV